MYTLRAARREDAAAIRRLIWKVHINPAGLDWRRFVLAVGPEGELLGCGQLKPHPDGSIELASIAVQPDCRGQGIARAVIEHLLAQSGRPLYLFCASYLQNLYERFGFRVIGPEKMPPTFRRQWQMVNGFMRLLPRSMPRLLVMRLE